MMDQWTFDGSITINGLVEPPPVKILGSERHLMFPSGQRYVDKTAHIEAFTAATLHGKPVPDDACAFVHCVNGSSQSGYEQNVGHPADNENVWRAMPDYQVVIRYLRDALDVQIRGTTLSGRWGGDHDVSARLLPWTILIRFQAPLAELPTLFRLTRTDVALFEQRIAARH